MSSPRQGPPRLGLVGHLVSAHGGVTTTTEVMAGLLEADGYEVLTTSSQPGALGRLVETTRSLVRWKGRVDVVLLSTYSGRSFLLADGTARLARARGLPVVLVLHGGGLAALFDEHPRWGRSVLRRARAVVSPSEFLAAAAGRLGVEAEVIPNPLPVEQYPFRHRRDLAPRLLWMRTFHEYYEPELAVRTLARVRDRFADATLTMAGPDEGQLEVTRRVAAELGVEDAVSFVGVLDMDGKLREFAAHDVFLNTNRVDNAPVSVLEAGAFGVPVVAAEVGGIPFLLRDGETALLVPPSDPDAMAAAVVRLLLDPVLAGALSSAGRELASRSAWPVVRDQWLDLVDRVLSPVVG